MSVDSDSEGMGSVSGVEIADSVAASTASVGWTKPFGQCILGVRLTTMGYTLALLPSEYSGGREPKIST